MGDSLPLDHALAAVREALATAYDLSLLHIRRTTDPDTYITVTHRPDPTGDRDQQVQHSAYAETLQEAGWEQALNLGALVLIPSIPPADTAPGTHTAIWSVTVDDVPDLVDAAYEARALQHDSEITEAVWTVTDATGRRHVIITDDDLANEPEHDGCIEPHMTADGYADCDGTLL
ncbi:hypothetical protein [Streptomyces sp. NPDC050988]|uniref:hypothetical protein n=1 Tax=Streptomyces sp. NPDC050988 TaxID=3365637 RepID=UPI0037A9E420